MTDVSDRNFGYLVAYVLPGFVVVAVIGLHSEAVGSWLSGPAIDSVSVGGFLFATLASLAAGMVISALRWLVLDRIHHATGVHPPAWEFSDFQSKRAGFISLAENHYRYYQHYGNMLVALIAVALDVRAVATGSGFPVWLVLIGLAALGALEFVASRDALRKYYQRTGALLGE